ncbi:tetratricopeptide repeat protein [Beggiatoa leptomitoformis]|uniref:Tetratricopeptide repeat protein n=1 Tax=Beggiatoa leptomitoformis TaxID=288004 RepID=A0A2N9YIA1_9GAMM|nr:tetratricopeptide repeat protein [Beggiatoa leptomitoformis]AUI70214.2 tetratricopeptide repeat protein [Beggiatoa leptomitoformis]QGX03624.1 tetratricopeptide repeat protein [Beggiatoa leptomitoformis]
MKCLRISSLTLVLTLCVASQNFAQGALLSVADPTKAIVELLMEAKKSFEEGQSEQAAALLERALRIDPRNPILWHNLAGVRLQQEDWSRAASLAAKSNALAVENKLLRVRNWIVIALACEGLRDVDCTKEARNRARALAN